MYIPLNKQRDYMYNSWFSRHNEFKCKMMHALIYCDQCGVLGSYVQLRKLDCSELGQIRHSCGGYLQFSETTTLMQYYRGLSAEQQTILDKEIAQRLARTIPDRLKEDKEHIKASCYVLDLFHRRSIRERSSIERQYGFPHLDPLNFPDKFPSCPHCGSKWLGPKPRLVSVFGIPVPKWIYPTPKPPQLCFKCRQTIS